MTTPSVIVEIDLDNDPNPNTATMPAFSPTDVSGYLRSVLSIRRGRQQELRRTETGTCSILMDNSERRFDPTDSTGPYYPDLKLMRRIRLHASWDSGLEPFEVGSSYVGDTDVLGSGVYVYGLFSGYIESITQNWQDPDATATINCVDMFACCARDSVSITASPENTYQRINRILNERAYTERASGSGGTSTASADRNIAVTGRTVQAVTYDGKNMLEALNETDASEGGVFFISKDGVITFYGLGHDQGTADLTWGDDGTELRYRYDTVTGDYDDETLWNQITVTAPTLADQGASDATSQAAYFIRPLTVSTLNTTIVETEAIADYLLARYKDPGVRIRQIEVANVPNASWPDVLARDLWDKIVVKRRPPGGGTLEQPSMIEGISMSIPNVKEWHVTWTLSPSA